MSVRFIGLGLVLGALALSCGSPAPSAKAETGAPTETWTNPWLTNEALSQAIEIRLKLGLRSDPAWVHHVAMMPEALPGIPEYGLPLTPDELTELRSRASTFQETNAVIDRYGREHPDEWAGSSANSRRDAVVARFTGHVEEHEANLRRRLAPGAPFFVTEAQWTLGELEAVRTRISDEWLNGAAWFREHGFVPTVLAIDVQANQVELRVSSTRSEIDELVEAHYGAEGMIWVISDGIGVALLPKGDIGGRVIDHEGKPVPGATIEVWSSVAGAGPPGDIGYGTNAAGRFLVQGLPAVVYTIDVYSGGEDGGYLGSSGPIHVVAGEATEVVVVVG